MPQGREPFCACYANGPLGGSLGEGKHTNGCTPFLYPNNMKKFSLLLILLFCWNVYSAWGYDVKVGGIYYNLDSDNHTASVTYASVSSYTGDVVVPEEISVNGTKYAVTSLGNYCFDGCTGLTSITIPSSVTNLERNCFENCTGLTSITIPSSVTSLGVECFENCTGLTSITIPSSVTSLGYGCFAGCSGIAYIKVDANNPVYDSRDNCNAIIETSTNEMIAGCKNSHIPSSVTSLGEYCFWDCTGLTSITIPSSVTSLGGSCFYGCTGLTSVTIPSSVTSLEYQCFSGCTSLTSITIPSSVTSLGDQCFSDCTGLTSITIPSSVTSLGGYCFGGCTGLTSITIPNSVTSLGDWCIDASTSYPIYAYPCSYTPLEEKYGNRVHLCGGPVYKLLNKGRSQTTLSSEIVLRTDVDFIPEENGENLRAVEKKVYISYKDTVSLPFSSDHYLVMKDLVPNKSYLVYGYVKYSDGNEACLGYYIFRTKGTEPYIRGSASSPTVVTYEARITPGDAHVKEVIVNGETVDPSQITRDGDRFVFTVDETGLLPKSAHKGYITVTTEEGSTETVECADFVTTPALELTTLQPKCVSSSCAIVAATTNIAEEEMNVGFQWKKYDAPESLAPSEAYAAIYDGQLEGYLRNLQSTSYYNVRAFYKAKTGDYYYGDWVTFDPSDFSYFEPTVHTYPATKTTDCTASVRGYVLAGTDNITEQGFEYWETSGPATTARMTKSVLPSAKAADKSVVLATGQVMQVVLDGLKPQTTYTYRAFVRTAGGTTYGEEQTFTTDVPTGIGAVQADKAAPTVTGYYDLSGRRLTSKQRGVVIERYADGTSRKVLVK